MREFIVQYQKIRTISYLVKANNEQEAQVVAFNLRERNQGYDDYEDDDMHSDEIVSFYRCMENKNEDAPCGNNA